MGLKRKSHTQPRFERDNAPPVKKIKRANNPPDNPSEDSDKRPIIRIGRMLKGNDKSNPDALPLHVVTVAMIDRKSNNQITYYNVDTWVVNGRRIGDYSSAEKITSIYRIAKFEPDKMFERPYHDGRLAEHVLQCLEPGQPRPVDDYDSDVPQTRRKKTAKHLELARKKAPLRPTHTFDLHRSANGRQLDYGEDIDAVICFVNDLTESTMRLPRNYQATLDHNESYQSFLDFVRDTRIDRHSETTLGQSFEATDFMYWADIEIWVLPQDAMKMSSWTANTDHIAEDFLEPELSSTCRRQLYIQVRIKGHPDAKRKDTEWAAEMKIASCESPSSVKVSNKKTASKGSRSLLAIDKETISTDKLDSRSSTHITKNLKGTGLRNNKYSLRNNCNKIKIEDAQPVLDDSTLSPTKGVDEKVKRSFEQGDDFKEYLRA